LVSIDQIPLIEKRLASWGENNPLPQNLKLLKKRKSLR